VYFCNLAPAPSESEIIAGRRSRLVVRASDDDGVTWPLARVVVPGPAGYSDLAVAPGGHLLVLFETGRMMYSEKLTLAEIAPAVWREERARTRGELAAERYDFVRARAVLASPAWRPLVEVRNGRATGRVEHAWPAPVVTRSLLLAVTGVAQPDGLAYLQELEVWGSESAPAGGK
jgi:hypothetical protein